MDDQIKAEKVFHAARTKADPAERRVYVDSVCGNDTVLRGNVEALLLADAEAGEFLNSVERSTPDPDATVRQTAHAQARLSEGPGSVIGRYKLLQQIGEGGFGSVFMAEQQSPVIRKVALKIIKL